jgi:hypothetical protein
MDFKGQTAVLSAILVIVGVIFLVPAITEKALAAIHATAKGACGPGVGMACNFTLVKKDLKYGEWTSLPSESGNVVTWSTGGGSPIGDEEGSVTYKVTGPSGQEETAVLHFKNPVLGKNECDIKGIGGSCHFEQGSTLDPLRGYNADFTYNLRGR